MASTLSLLVFLVATSVLVYLYTGWACQRQAKQLQAVIDRERRLRKEERAGRTRAEKRLREATTTTSKSKDSQARDDAATNPTTYPFKPIGVLESCFRQRNGTPRQPLLVSAAKSRLKLRPGVPHASLEGLTGFSHCWIIYVFHCNTDLHDLWSESDRGIKAKVHVPKLNGKRTGLFATRSPHRPNPIGLSVAQIESVQGNTVVFRGADVVDGTPVLDIKPYVPFVDGVTGATAPHWVSNDDEDSVLHVSAVTMSDQVNATFPQRWREYIATKPTPQPLCDDAKEFKELVVQVLSRDIRSLHQRLQHTDKDPDLLNHRGDTSGTLSQYRVMLDGLDVLYNFDQAGNIEVIDIDVDRLFGDTNS